MPSASMDDERVSAKATNLSAAMVRFAARAAMIALLPPLADMIRSLRSMYRQSVRRRVPAVSGSYCTETPRRRDMVRPAVAPVAGGDVGGLRRAGGLWLPLRSG